ncbi:MAG: preprotein translocase subunit SecY [Acidimicrobiales bacterium]
MLSSLRNMFKVPDLRNKIGFTVLIIMIYRFGAHITCPAIDETAVQKLVSLAKSGGVLGFLNLFSGGALTHFAIFGLGIMPYITSSIIIQLLMVVIPKLEKWRDEGPTGQKKLTQATRYMTVVLALLQSTGLAYVFGKGGTNTLLGTSGQNIILMKHFDVPHVLMVVLTMTAGTAVVMWLGETVTQRGIGQGMSILIFANVVSTLPSQGSAIRANGGNLKFFVILGVVLILLGAIVFMEQGQRRIPVQFAKRVVGRRMYGGQSTYIPLKVNQAGVIPIIFASSVLYLPALLSNVIPQHSFQNIVNRYFLSPTNAVYLLMYGLLIIAFAYFYTAIQFDPHQQAELIRKQGGYIPGYRPGAPTEKYLTQILNRITLPGSLFLASVALVPSVLLSIWHIKTSAFAGTTLLIAVGVALETMKQVDSQLMMRNYDTFLSK